ncbi:hypothetical protein [Winogradskya humida]|uniref:Phage terminase large subunit-like protein n=1 Tax=Winogradskya humida TaxID=113566 RepID=A0ABQ4A772_9ACTN|nr:hypothetical protein [Actinoplanes humidus]GIE26684.1 hypothetical protein Ahu01nite_097860 [Actinoplanes humidus]
MLARRRVDPTWLSHPDYVETYGPEVADICALAGFPPDPVQELILDLTFAIGPDGKSAAFEIDIIGPRQQFKTGVIKQMELGWLFVTEERLIVHSAHELDTTAEAFRELADLIESAPSLSKRLAPSRGERPGISEGNGRWAIELTNGQRVKYKARTKSSGRGLTGNKIVLDEAFALQPTHMGALLPTLAAVPDPQVVKASSAGKADSLVLHEAKDRGRAALSPRQVYVEYGDLDAHKGCRDSDCDHAKTARGCAFDDEERWGRIMPALHGRVTVETVRSMRQSMPPEEFGREFMVWWDDPEDEAGLPLEAWGLCADVASAPISRPVFMIDAAPKSKSAAIVAAMLRPDGLIHLEVVDHRPGTAWLPGRAVQLLKHRPLDWVIDPGGPAGALLPDLITAKIEPRQMSTRDLGQACEAFSAAVENHGLRHLGDPVLARAIRSAARRDIGDGLWAWSRRRSDVDITTLVGATGAFWGLSVVPPEKPKPPPPVNADVPLGVASETNDLATAGF